MVERGAQILQIEQQEPLLVGDLEDDVENAFLRVVEVEKAREEQRAHLRHGRADHMALLAEHVPENDREAVRLIVDADFPGAFDEGRLALAGLREAREIALDVREKHGGPGVGIAFRQQLQRDGLAAARGARDQPVAIAERKREIAIGPRPGPMVCPVVCRLGRADENFSGDAIRGLAGFVTHGRGFPRGIRDSRKATSSRRRRKEPRGASEQGSCSKAWLGESRGPG